MVGFNARRKSVIITGNALSPIQKNVFMVDCVTGKRTLINANGEG